MPVIQMPDGTRVTMPDNPTPAQLAGLKVLRDQQLSSSGGGLSAIGDWVSAHTPDAVKNVATAAYKGAAELAAGAADAFTGQSDPMDLAAVGFNTAKVPPPPPVGAVSTALEKTGYQPKTQGERYVASGVRGAAAALTSPGGVGQSVTKAAVGASSGLGSEVGARLLGDTPGARLIGGLLGGGAAGLAVAPFTNKVAMAKEALADVSPEALATAKQNMVDMELQGVKGNLSQAMPVSSNIDALVDTLANNRYGKQITAQLRQQPVDISFGAEDQLHAIPGAVREPQIAANNIQDAATAAIQQAKDGRSQAWKQVFDQSLQGLQNTANSNVEAAVAKAKTMADRFEIAQSIERAKALPAPATAIPTGIGATPGGILLNDSGRGAAAINSLASVEGRNSLQQGSSMILGPDGQALVRPNPSGDLTGFAGDLQAANRRVAAAQATADSVGSVPPDSVSAAYRRLTALAADTPNTGLGTELTALRDKLRNGEQWVTDSGQLNAILKDVTTRLKSPDLSTKGVDAGQAKYLGTVVDSLRNDFGDAFRPVRDANAAYSAITQDVVDPLKKSVVGRMAQPRGAFDDKEATVSKVLSLFDKGTVPGAQSSEILTLEKSLRKVKQAADGTGVDGPAAFQDAVKTWMAGKVDSALKAADSRAPESAAANLTRTFGVPSRPSAQSQGVQDALAGMARSQGLPDAAYVKGFQNFMQTVSMAARRPATVQGVSQAGFDSVAGNSALRSVGNFSVITPVRQPVLRWVEYLKGNAYSEMDRLLTSPEGVDMLQKLAKQAPMSPAAVKAVSAFLGTQAAQDPNPNSPGITTP